MLLYNVAIEYEIKYRVGISAVGKAYDDFETQF